MDKLLIITSKSDYHSDHLINYLNNLGFGDTVIRLNTEDFYTNISLTFQYLEDTQLEIFIKDSNKHFYGNDIKSVWYRRPDKIEVNLENKDVSKFIYSQTKSVLEGIYHYLHNSSNWFNRLDKNLKARIKMDQFFVAKFVGFHIPKTIISNNFEHIEKFVKKNKYISNKSLGAPNFELNGSLYSYFNRKVDKEEIYGNQESIELCSNLFQEYIEKESDIRVVYIGGDIFSFEIKSQVNELSIEDFRGVTPYWLEHRIHKLPKEIEQKIKKFLKYYDLNYSAMDFVLGKDGRYYFLENNPNGQWLWLEYATDFNLTKYFVLNFYKNTEHYQNIKHVIENEK